MRVSREERGQMKKGGDKQNEAKTAPAGPKGVREMAGGNGVGAFRGGGLTKSTIEKRNGKCC